MPKIFTNKIVSLYANRDVVHSQRFPVPDCVIEPARVIIVVHALQHIVIAVTEIRREAGPARAPFVKLVPQTCFASLTS